MSNHPKIEPEKLAVYEAQVAVLQKIVELQTAIAGLWGAYLADVSTDFQSPDIARLLKSLHDGMARYAGEVRSIRIRYYGNEGPQVAPDLSPLPPVVPDFMQHGFPVKYLSFYKGTGGYRPNVAHLYQSLDAAGRMVTYCGRRATLPHVHADVVTDRAICQHCMRSEAHEADRALRARERRKEQESRALKDDEKEQSYEYQEGTGRTDLVEPETPPTKTGQARQGRPSRRHWGTGKPGPRGTGRTSQHKRGDGSPGL